MAFPAADPSAAVESALSPAGDDADRPRRSADVSSRFRTFLLAAYRRLALRVEAYPLERIGLAALAAGIVLRIAAPFYMDFRADGDTYTAMGHAWATTHSFLMPYGDVTTWGPTPPGYSNHYPPAYPLYLGIVFSLFGFGLWQAKIAAVVMAIAALAVVYYATRDLYGNVPAALAAGLIALEPHLVWVTGSGFSENMVLLFFALTMWAILKSLTDDRYILLAGLFAGLAYLARASVGYFFVIAGAGGFLWRFYYRRWALFTNYWYMGAIVIFLGIAGAWAFRNASLFPPITDAFFGYRVTVPAWETSSYTRYVQNYAITVDSAHNGPERWQKALVSKAPFFLAMIGFFVLPFLPEAWRATKRIKEEQTSALWLSVFLVWVIAWVIASMFWVFEQSPMYWFDNHRYILIGILPLVWLLFREARWERASPRLRYICVILALFAASGSVFTDPIRFSDLRAAEFMDDYLQEGDEIGVDGSTIKYAFYAYLSHPELVRVYGCEAPPTETTEPPSGPCRGGVDSGNNQADFIVSLRHGGTYPGYDLVGTFRQKFSDGGVMTSTLWARDDIVKARSIPVNVEQDGY